MTLSSNIACLMVWLYNVYAHRFLFVEGRNGIELADIVDPEEMGETNMANQIVSLRVVVR